MGESNQGIYSKVKHSISTWLFDRCFSYCVHYMYPDADPEEFMLVDMTYFDVVEKEL